LTADRDKSAKAHRRSAEAGLPAPAFVAVCIALEKKADPSINDSFLCFIGRSPCDATMWATYKAGFERERTCRY
ncbi:hypothetical protein, partial [Achromobacter insuavis]|uniref:hypothetical protein n=1 Tax=Achromobacter insuavis TaxID=1287735 RepID=UPI001F146C31